MAVIPQIVTSPGAVPGAPSAPSGGGVPRASPQMDVRAPSDPSAAQVAGANLEAGALELTARSAEKMAAYGEQFAEKYVTAKLNIDAANRTADMSALLHQAEFESSKIADRDAATADFDGRAAKIRDDFAAQDVNPRVRAAVDASLPNQIALRRASTQNAAFGLWAKAQVGELTTNLDQYNKQAVDSADPRLTEQLIAQANAAIDGRVEGGALGADVAAKLKVDFGSNVYRTKIEIAMAKDMRAGLALFEATKDKLNAADLKIMTNMATDRAKQVDADSSVSANMPTMSGGTGGGDVGPVRADAEKTLGFPLTITSADRTEAHNKAVGGATGSQHLQPGKALDISLAGLSDDQKQKLYQHFLNDPRVGGIGFYDGHLHVDARGGPRATWGTPPAGVADQVKTWQAGGPAAPSGDQYAQTRVAQARYIQSIATDPNLDPEVKQRRIAVANQRMGIENTIVMEQRKSAADAGEKAGIDLNTGKYKPGTFQQIADQFTKTGDSSNAAVYQELADKEASLIEDARNPPDQRSTASMLLPGAAGKIAAQQHAIKAAELTEQRRLAAQYMADNKKSLAEEEKIIDDSIGTVDPKALAQNMRNAMTLAHAIGDKRKEAALLQKFDAMIEGATMAKLPPAERERIRNELVEQMNSGTGLTVRDATLAKWLEKNREDNRQRWDQDLLAAAHNLGPQYGGVTLQDFNVNLMADPVALGLWSGKRLSDLTTATARRDGSNASVLPANFFTQTEMSDITQRLSAMKPQEQKMFLAQLARGVPPQAIALIGEQMSKKDAVSDSHAAALGLFSRNKPNDAEIAGRVIDGMNIRTQGGEDGKTRIDVNAALFTAIDQQVGGARAGMTPDAVRMQNNAIISNYLALTRNAPDRANIKPEELRQAITEIVGKRAHINDADTLIPRELETYQVKNGIAAIGPADVTSLRAADDGKPITDALIRQQGQLVPYGDGTYTVVIPDPLKAARVAQVIDNNTGKPWVIDINRLVARGVSTNAAVSEDVEAMRARSGLRPAPVPVQPKPVPPRPPQ